MYVCVVCERCQIVHFNMKSEMRLIIKSHSRLFCKYFNLIHCSKLFFTTNNFQNLSQTFDIWVFSTR